MIPVSPRNNIPASDDCKKVVIIQKRKREERREEKEEEEREEERGERGEYHYKNIALGYNLRLSPCTVDNI